MVYLLCFGRDTFNSDRSAREKWSTSKGGPVFSNLFRLDQTDPLRIGPKFPEILVEWIGLFVFPSLELVSLFSEYGNGLSVIKLFQKKPNRK